MRTSVVRPQDICCPPTWRFGVRHPGIWCPSTGISSCPLSLWPPPSGGGAEGVPHPLPSCPTTSGPWAATPGLRLLITPSGERRPNRSPRPVGRFTPRILQGRLTKLTDARLRHTRAMEPGPIFKSSYDVAMKTVAPLTDLLKLIRSLTLSRTPSSTPLGGLPIRQVTQRMPSVSIVADGLLARWPTRCTASAARPPQRKLGAPFPSQP